MNYENHFTHHRYHTGRDHDRTAVLKPSTVEVEPPAPVTEISQPKPAPVTEKEIIEEPASEEIPEPTLAPEKENESTQAPETASAPVPDIEPMPTPTPASEPIVDHAKTSPEPVPEIVVDYAKTTEPEIIIDSAKTGSDILEGASVIVEEPAHGSADLQTAMDAANAYAQTTYGVILDTSLGFDNSGYRFPANAPVGCTQEFLNDKACGIVDYTFNQLMAVNHKSIDDVRSAGFLCSVYVYAEDDNIYVYCFYA